MKVSWKRKNDRATRRRYKNQIRVGLLITVVGLILLVCAISFEQLGSLLLSIFLIPVGIYLIFAREKWID